MPSKKNPPPNGFFYFMQSLRPALKREGVFVQNNRELADLAGPRWAVLSPEEREPFNAQAKREKQNRKYGPQPDKMDCTRQYISQRVDTVQLNEQRRRKERKSVVESWLGKDVSNERFLMISFMSLCDMPDDKYMPCEMAIAEYSLKSGITRTLHKYIDPGTIPLGYRFTAMQQSEATHQIPPEGLSTENYHDIYDQVLQFVNPRKLNTYPPVYCKASESKLTEFSLDWLASRAGSPNKIKKVYELGGLVCDLFAESKDAETKVAPSKHNVMELLSTTVFDYESGARCKWHEEKEIRFCASGTVKRYCYCMSDFLCGAFGIEQTSNHLPERPEGDCCVVLTPRTSNGNARAGNARSRGRRVDEADMNYRDYRNNNTYQSTDVKKRPYTRSGPTYDEESLKSTDVVPPPSSRSTVPTGLPTFGRGRGRGHLIPAAQPLRRPNMPGIAGRPGAQGNQSSGLSGQSSSSPSSLWSDEHVLRATSNSPSDPSSNLSSPWSGSLGAGRGRGLRPPNTAPMGWAGPASAPDASVAPLPPTAWRQGPSSSAPWKQVNNVDMDTASADWPSLGATSNGQSSGLHQKFQSFSLFDRDEYDY
ncbi:protein maelstrom homolog [Dendronephthya gigantea]|uniref:protein maelstrom homolog n=1 Tax=Dendronephthya gigantea TaxID=151771 RepID=UPI0010696D64|nr:protein maelstrom homolog [Dendronephthya gigantea]